MSRRVRLDVVDQPVEAGDYILNHVGFAIRRIPPEEIGETLALYETLLAEASKDDLMAADVRGEIEGDGAGGSRREPDSLAGFSGEAALPGSGAGARARRARSPG